MRAVFAQWSNSALPAPSVILGFILATLLGAAFHLVFGGDVRRLAMFLLAGWIGFFFGHIAGVVLDIEVLNIGPLRAAPAVIGALVLLVGTLVLTGNRVRKRAVR